MATHFDLEAAIGAWRRPLEHTRAFLDDDIDELEVHLRDHLDRLVADGLDEEAAFRRATARLGVVNEHLAALCFLEDLNLGYATPLKCGCSRCLELNPLFTQPSVR